MSISKSLFISESQHYKTGLLKGFFPDLKKAFDRTPSDNVWCALRKLSIEEWLVRFIQCIGIRIRTQIRII